MPIHNYKGILLASSKATNPPDTWARMYGIISAMGCLPATAIIIVTAGLKLPPDIGPPIITAIAKAAPIAKALPVVIITYKKNIVPKNSTTNLLIMYLC